MTNRMVDVNAQTQYDNNDDAHIHLSGVVSTHLIYMKREREREEPLHHQNAKKYYTGCIYTTMLHQTVYTIYFN
jgi:hypothetical protein